MLPDQSVNHVPDRSHASGTSSARSRTCTVVVSSCGNKTVATVRPRAPVTTTLSSRMTWPLAKRNPLGSTSTSIVRPMVPPSAVAAAAASAPASNVAAAIARRRPSDASDDSSVISPASVAPAAKAVSTTVPSISSRGTATRIALGATYARERELAAGRGSSPSSISTV